MDDSVITYDEIIDTDVEAKLNKEEIKTFPTKYNRKKKTYIKNNFFILLTFLLIAISLLIAVSIHCYLIKYWAKQKHLVAFHNTKNELK